jgi:hypothetical protein
MKQITRCYGLFTGVVAILAMNLLLPQASAQALIIADDFNGTSLNTNVWAVITACCDSQMYASNSYGVFVNSGKLLSKAPLPAQYLIQGSFQFTGNSYDQFLIAIRSSGNYVPYQLQDGIQIRFQLRSGDQGATGVQNIIIVDTMGTTTNASFPIQMNTLYPFTIVDNATNVLLYLNGATTPILTMNTTNRSGTLLGLQNREGACCGSSISAGSVTQLDYLQVYQTRLSIYTAIELDFVALLGQTYQLQRSTNLINWINVGSPITGSNQTVQQLFSTRGTNAQFYQLQNVTP